MTGFTTPFTARQLNRGDGMQFHPVSGRALSALKYNRSRACFFTETEKPAVLWLCDEEWECSWEERIGTGKKEHKPGDAYPSHWKFNPWTGEAA